MSHPCTSASVLLFASLGFLSSCASEETARALGEIAGARSVLARAQSSEVSGPGQQAVTLAREALAEAEQQVRREGSRLRLFGEGDWRPQFERALGLTRMATWVFERDLKLLQNDAEAYIETARTMVERQQSSRFYLTLPATVRADLVRASLATSEADYLLSRAKYQSAIEKARWACELVGAADRDVQELLARFQNPERLDTWASWVDRAVALSRKKTTSALVVDKHRHLAILYANGNPVSWFDVDLGHASLKQKKIAKDGATPEGFYRVVSKKKGSATRYYKALLLDYPNAEDRARFQEALRAGRIERGSHIGGLIEIHGEGGRGTDWTDGCVALSNSDMDELFLKLSPGSPVAIVGTYSGDRIGVRTGHGNP